MKSYHPVNPVPAVGDLAGQGLYKSIMKSYHPVNLNSAVGDLAGQGLYKSIMKSYHPVNLVSAVGDLAGQGLYTHSSCHHIICKKSCSGCWRPCGARTVHFVRALSLLEPLHLMPTSEQSSANKQGNERI